ncbi:complement factor H-like, partial [Penaeus indicus]|uniref:complement factor H-like n=1 Tax=Penaeus indicus TaxID=29960 RepID=UPI00300CFFA1
PDCKDEPPAAPENAIHTWQPGIYPSGMSVAYTCKEAYSDANTQMAMSKCNGGVWEAATPVLNCKHTGCLMSPPQVPDHGSINWNQQRGAGAKAVYGCIDGYKSDNGYYPQVECVNKTWVGFPSEWRCIRNDAPLKEVVVPQDETELNYFFVVTIPSVGGLVLVILFCLCCTRTDSPLFNICSTKVSKHYSKA